MQEKRNGKQNIKCYVIYHITSHQLLRRYINCHITLHVTVKGSIVYKALKAKINILGKEPDPCRMLPDIASDKTYIVQKVADK